jgi:hypothetical protein
LNGGIFLFAQNGTLLNFKVILCARNLVLGSVRITINSDKLFDETCAVGAYVETELTEWLDIYIYIYIFRQFNRPDIPTENIHLLVK